MGMVTIRTRTFGDELFDARKRKGWTQAEAAGKIGCDYVAVSLYEAGKRTPSYRRLASICEVFGLDLKEMAQLAYGTADKSK